MTEAKCTFKVYCERGELPTRYAPAQIYDAYMLVETPAADRAALTGELDDRGLLYEEITDEYTIRIGESVIDTGRQRLDASGREHEHPAYPDAENLTAGKPHHYLVQFAGPIKQEWLQAAKDLQIELREPVGSFTYIMRSSKRPLMQLLKKPFVRWIGHLPHRDRDRTGAGQSALETALEARRIGVGAQSQKGTFAIDFFDSGDREAATAIVRGMGLTILPQPENSSSSLMVVEIRGKKIDETIRKLSEVHGVRSIRRRVRKKKKNDVATALMRVENSPPDVGYGGRGEVIAICDSGLDTGHADNIHPDFAGRIVDIASYPTNPSYVSADEIYNPRGQDDAADFSDGHGTHVAGSALGSGAASAAIPGRESRIRGVAYQARLYFQAVEQAMDWIDPDDYKEWGRYLLAGFPDDLGDLFLDAYDRGARIHSNSWGSVSLGDYDDEAFKLDDFVRGHRDFTILMAAGNDGNDARCEGRIRRSTVAPPGTAKNCITVGASESRRPEFNDTTYGRRYPDDFPCSPFHAKPLASSPNQVAAFSSRGPVEGGRTKPDVVAPGTYILSTRSRAMEASDNGWARLDGNSDYFYLGGTSMATPLVAGAAAVVREYLREVWGIRNASAALVKAALIGGASRLYGYGEDGRIGDDDQGYGLVNIAAIVNPQAPVNNYFYDGTEGLGSGQRDRWRLVVDSGVAALRIALVYTDMPGADLVNNLNLILRHTEIPGTYVGNLFHPIGPGPLPSDNRNNVEVLHVENPHAGAWHLDVIASNVPGDGQDYALFFSGDIRSGPTTV